MLVDLTPINEIENYWQQTSQIYLDNINFEGVFELNSEDQENLLTIADMEGKLNGPGVYQARAMLDTLMAKDNPQKVDVKTYLSNGKIIIAPNPANNYINIQISDYDLSIADVRNIKIYDVTGNLVKKLVVTSSGEIYIGDLQSGFYILQFQIKNLAIITNKLFIEK